MRVQSDHHLLIIGPISPWIGVNDEDTEETKARQSSMDCCVSYIQSSHVESPYRHVWSSHEPFCVSHICLPLY